MRQWGQMMPSRDLEMSPKGNQDTFVSQINVLDVQKGLWDNWDPNNLDTDNRDTDNLDLSRTI